MLIENTSAGTANRKKGEQTGQIHISTGRNLKGENLRPVTSINTSLLKKRKREPTKALFCLYFEILPLFTKDRKNLFEWLYGLFVIDV